MELLFSLEFYRFFVKTSLLYILKAKVSYTVRLRNVSAQFIVAFVLPSMRSA